MGRAAVGRDGNAQAVGRDISTAGDIILPAINGSMDKTWLFTIVASVNSLLLIWLLVIHMATPNQAARNHWDNKLEHMEENIITNLHKAMELKAISNREWYNSQLGPKVYLVVERAVEDAIADQHYRLVASHDRMITQIIGSVAEEHTRQNNYWLQMGVTKGGLQ